MDLREYCHIGHQWGVRVPELQQERGSEAFDKADLDNLRRSKLLICWFMAALIIRRS
jgi:hypothetical protein